MHRLVSAVLTLIFLVAPQAQSASAEHAAAIDATDSTKHYAVIAPTYLGNGVGPQTYLRLFNGKIGATSTFTVTLVGLPSGRVYGTAFTVPVPHMASIQLSVQEVEDLAGAGSFTGGDTGFAIYLQNSDSEAGYQQAVYDWTSQLFENTSNCGSLMNEQMLTLQNKLILANVHTSKAGGGNFPSTIIIHNYGSTATTYVLDIYNAGGRLSGTGVVLSTNSGKFTCEYDTSSVAANSSISIPFATIENSSNCAIDSDQTYADIAVSNQSGAPPAAIVTHSIHVAQYNGNSNFTDVCAVNKVANAQVTSTAKFQGTIAGANGQSGTFTVTVQAAASASASSTVPVAHQQGVVERAQALQVSGTLVVTGGATVVLTGTYDASTNEIIVSGGGYTFIGTVYAGAFSGSYTGPNNANGGFTSVNGTQNAVTAYCGSYTGSPGGSPDSGIFNMVLSAGGALAGIVRPTSGGGQIVYLSGQGTSTSVSGISSETVLFSGSVQNGTLNGTYGIPAGTTATGGGTFTGTTCAVPAT